MLLLALVLFLWVSLYRFNTLSGALGGFDNDHFLHFTLAKHVQLGEQPLRDFLDAGLQGARPSLTYELSAAAQRYLGNNLRSEAWLTVAGMALGASLTFVAGSYLAPVPLAFMTAVLSALLSPKLYGYPKVVVLAGASLLIVRYAANQSWRHVALMAVWTAVAFLFRHDYAIYCGVGFVAVIGASRGRAWATRAAHVVGYGLLTVALLGPSLWWIQRYTGLVEYVRNALEMSEREAQRTNLDWPKPSLVDWPSPLALFDREENTEAWLYYLFLALAAIAVVVAVRSMLGRRDADSRASALLALGLMALLLFHYFLRGSLEARFGDMGPPVAVIAAALLAASLTRRAARPVSVLTTRLVALTVLAVTVLSIWTLHSVRSELAIGNWLESPAKVAERARLVSQRLAALPDEVTTTESSPEDAVQYLRRCTRETDRVLMLAYAPEALALSGRGFAGGRAAFYPGFYLDERYSRYTIARLDQESVPIALAEPEDYYEEFPLLPDYIRSRYMDVGTVLVGSRRLKVLLRRGEMTKALDSSALPCRA